MYRVFFRAVLQRVDPERAHALAQRALRLLRSTSAGRAAVHRLAGSPDPCLRTRALGLTFSTPLGVAAGLDKDASWFEDLGALGFGFVEVGTITAVAQEGNPPPRIRRLPRDRALLNRMGFPNPGAEAVVGRLAARSGDVIAGVNIGKSRGAPLEQVSEDYRRAARHLIPVADYLVLNVSSPNTPGLRALQEVDQLRLLVESVRGELVAAGQPVPLLVKIDPDLGDEAIEAIVRLALELDLDGIVAVNTTVDRGALTDPAAGNFSGGGVSGPPLRSRALDVLRLARRIAGRELVLISVGGVEGPGDVWERILAGATLVQAYTAFVYGGPAWPGRINRELARRVREVGASSIQEMVGVERPDPARSSPD